VDFAWWRGGPDPAQERLNAEIISFRGRLLHLISQLGICTPPSQQRLKYYSSCQIPKGKELIDMKCATRESFGSLGCKKSINIHILYGFVTPRCAVPPIRQHILVGWGHGRRLPADRR